jgi:hypothetical protein
MVRKHVFLLGALAASFSVQVQTAMIDITGGTAAGGACNSRGGVALLGFGVAFLGWQRLQQYKIGHFLRDSHIQFG